MVSFFTYTIGVSVTLLLLWATYSTSIRGEKRLRTSRITILSIYAVSLVTMPLLNHLKKTGSLSMPDIYTGPIRISYDSLQNVADLMSTLSIIWATGAIITSIIVIIESIRIVTLIRKCEKKELNGLRIYLTDNNSISPFSLGRIIVINRRDFNDHREMIIRHETGHIRQGHTFDMFLAQMFTILCWYNPAAWLLRSELKNIHEFQADAFTLVCGTDPHDYQMFLISRAASSRFPAIASGLNRSSLKRRILMMQLPENKKRRIILYAVPVIGLLTAILILNIPQIRTVLNSDRFASSSRVEPEAKQFDDMPPVYIDGTEISGNQMQKIPTNEIKSITINKDHARIDIEMK